MFNEIGPGTKYTNPGARCCVHNIFRVLRLIDVLLRAEHHKGSFSIHIEYLISFVAVAARVGLTANVCKWFI